MDTAPLSLPSPRARGLGRVPRAQRPLAPPPWEAPAALSCQSRVCVSTAPSLAGRLGEHPSLPAGSFQRHQPVPKQDFGERWDKAASPAVGSHTPPAGRPPRPQPLFEGDEASPSWEFPEGFFIHGSFPPWEQRKSLLENRHRHPSPC